MFCHVGKPTCDLYRFHDGRVLAQLVFAWPSYFSSCHEIRMLKVLQRHRDLGVVKISGVCQPYGRTELLQREALSQHWLRVPQGDISIGLDRKCLVKLRSERESQCHHVAAVEPVQRTTTSELELKVSLAVRVPGFCTRHSCAPHPS